MFFAINMNMQIVDAARTWVGTRFSHQGRLKATPQHKGGCDCLGLLMGVAKELNLTHKTPLGCVPLLKYDTRDYGRLPDNNKLRQTLSKVLQEVPLNAILPGDILLLRVDGAPQHLAIVCDYRKESDGVVQLGIIHAYAPVRAVVEHCLDEGWKQCMVAAYRFHQHIDINK